MFEYEICMNAIADAAIVYLTGYVDLYEDAAYEQLQWWIAVWNETWRIAAWESQFAH